MKRRKFLQSLGLVAAAPLATGVSMGRAAGADAPARSPDPVVPKTIAEFAIMAASMFAAVESITRSAYDEGGEAVMYGFGKAPKISEPSYVDVVPASAKVYQYMPTRGGQPATSAEGAVANAWSEFAPLAAGHGKDTLVWRHRPELMGASDFESNVKMYRVWLRAYIKTDKPA